MIVMTAPAHSQVWQHTQEWNQEWERKYGEWVNSDEVYERMFVDRNSPYSGVRADCADAAHGLRIIFAYENGLPFAVRNPSGSRGDRDPYRNFHNGIDRFNHISDQDRRVVQFINYVGNSMGSHFLTHDNTFPVKLEEIGSGDMFTYRIRARFGNFIRHVYNIKAVNPTGTFDVIYATQAIKDNNLPMIRRREREFVHRPQGQWGFRRFRWPEHIGQPLSAIPSELGNSSEQFRLSSELGNDFFPHLTRLLRTTVETPEARLKRSLRNLCLEAQGRVDNVAQAITYLNSINGRCMDYTEFDIYSTPARDEALNQTFLNTQRDYQEILDEGLGSRVDPNLLDMTAEIFSRSSNRQYVEELTDFCPVEIRAGRVLDLGELRRRQVDGKLSSHPNDTFEHRWGEPTRDRLTRCRRHY